MQNCAAVRHEREQQQQARENKHGRADSEEWPVWEAIVRDIVGSGVVQVPLDGEGEGDGERKGEGEGKGEGYGALMSTWDLGFGNDELSLSR